MRLQSLKKYPKILSNLEKSRKTEKTGQKSKARKLFLLRAKRLIFSQFFSSVRPVFRVKISALQLGEKKHFSALNFPFQLHHSWLQLDPKQTVGNICTKTWCRCVKVDRDGRFWCKCTRLSVKIQFFLRPGRGLCFGSREVSSRNFATETPKINCTKSMAFSGLGSVSNCLKFCIRS